MKIVRIGTRKSKLALTQTELVVQKLKEFYPEFDYKVVLIQTKGDQVHHKPLRELFDGGKSAFTSELEKALSDNKIDIAVHSMKDVAGNIRLSNLIFPAFLERVSPLDVLVTKEKFTNIADLPKGFVIGTVSLRRQAGLLRLNPNIIVKNLRGSVQTRIAKLRGVHKWQGHTKIDYDGIIMAEAAIHRSDNDIDLTNLHSLKIKENEVIPAAGQGTIGVQCRREDTNIIKILSKINHKKTEREVRIERDFLCEMNGNCHTTIGVLCTHTDKEIILTAETSEENGNNLISYEASCTTETLNDNWSIRHAQEFKKKIVSEKGIEFLMKELNLTLQ